MQEGETVKLPETHAEVVRVVETLSVEEVRERFVKLLEAVNPSVECICSKLDQVMEGEQHTCAYHESRVGWIVHEARNLMPPIIE